MEESISEFRQEYYRSLSEFCDITKSEIQRSNILNSLLLMVSNQLDLVAVAVMLSDRSDPSVNRELKVIGMEKERSLNLLDDFNVKVKENTDDFRIAEHYIKMNAIRKFDSQSDSVKFVLQVDAKADIDCSIFLYTTAIQEFEYGMLRLLKHGVKMISNTYTMLSYLDKVKATNQIDNSGFMHNPLPMVLLSDKFRVLRINEEGIRIFGRLDQLVSINFLEEVMSSDQHFTILQKLQSLPLTHTIEFNRIMISNLTGDFDKEFMMETHLYIKKFQLKNDLYYILTLHVIDHDKKMKLKDKLDSSKNSLYQELRSYGSFYLESNSEALKYGRENFFPSAFAFTINEVTGPIILTSSPETEHENVFEETIKLMAGLNTGEILSQGYLTGMSPWSNPKGEIRWIAFYVENPQARGEVEIHMIGLVVKRDLLMIKPELSNTLLGLLLGSMNQYIDLIVSDKADFTTESFNQDRNFSTVSMIQNILDELRSGSAEVLAAYSLK